MGYLRISSKSIIMRKLLLFLFIISMGTTLLAQDLAQSSIQAMCSRNQEQIVSLAEAFTEDQFNWRPAQGIRSVGESILHVAQANYFFAMKLGFEVPEDVDMMTMASTTGKENIISTLKNSFDFVNGNLVDVPTSELQDKVETPFGEFTKMSMMLLTLEHSGEHKGQLIAYARSNGVVPPWSE